MKRELVLGSVQMNKMGSQDVEDSLEEHRQPEEVSQLLNKAGQADHEHRLRKEYGHDQFPHDKTAGQFKLLKMSLAIIAGLLVVSLPVMSVLHDVQQRDHDGAAAAYRHMKDRVPDGFPIHLPEGAGRPITKAPKPPSATGVFKPVLHPLLNYSSLLKPDFHLTALHGWMNDPNGMFQAPNGITHVFFQLNPVAPVWGSPWWGHVASDDMAHWRRLPPALQPDQWYDRDGVFSGSATLLHNGSVIVLYTGVIDSAQYGFLYQLQAAAVPSNTSDPYLVAWTKMSTNPISMTIPPGGTHAQFRDPVTVWTLTPNELRHALQQWDVHISCSGSNSSSSSSASGVEKGVGGDSDGEGGNACNNELVYMTAVGSMNNCLGEASLYVSTDELRSWKYVGSLFSQLGQNFSYYASCLPPPEERDKGDDVPPGSKGYGGHCDQFGKACRMWECPDFFDTNTPGIQAFKYSDQARERPQFAQDFYVLSESQLTNYSFASLQDGHDAYSGMLHGEYYPATPLDYGVVYASKSFLAADKRRLWLGWVFEDSLGCTELCADGTPFILDVLQWQGAQTLLREITYNADTQSLRFYPIVETRKLRIGEPLYDSSFLLHTHDQKDSPFAQVLLPEEHTYVADSGVQQAEGGCQDSSDSSSSPHLTPSMPSSASSSPSGRRQVEMLLSFTLQAEQSMLNAQDVAQLHPFEFALDLLTGNGTFTRIKVNGTASVPGGPSNLVECGTVRPSPHLLGGEQWPCVYAAEVWVDRESSGGMSKVTAQGGPIKLPAAGVKASDLSLAVWVDRSLLEVYAFDGSAVVTSRIYPLPLVEERPEVQGLDAGNLQHQQQAPAEEVTEKVQLGAWGYQVLAKWGAGHVKVKAEAHELGSCWVD